MPPIWITQKDEAIFRWLWMVRVLTIDQIRRLHYFQPATGQLSNLNNVMVRLRRLEHGGYLRGEFIRSEGTDHRQKVFFLGKAGLPYLRNHGIQQTQLYDFKKLNAYQQIYHSLMIAESVVRLVESMRGTEVTLPGLAPYCLPFYHTHAIGNPRAKKHTQRFITQEDVTGAGSRERFRIRPDGVFALEKEGRSRLFFLEADRGFEGVKEIAQKLAAYEHYARVSNHSDEPLWRKYGAMADFRVLFITTTVTRRNQLCERVTPGRGLVAWSTLDDVLHHNLLTGKLWMIAGQGLQPLMHVDHSQDY